MNATQESEILALATSYHDRLLQAMVTLHLRKLMEVPFPRDPAQIESYMWRLRYHNQLLPEPLSERALTQIEKRGVRCFVHALRNLVKVIDLGDPILGRGQKELFVELVSSKLRLRWAFQEKRHADLMQKSAPESISI